MSEDNCIRHAMNRSLSGLTGDPGLVARIITTEKEPSKMKSKASIGLILIAALLITGMTAALGAGAIGLFDHLLADSVNLPPEAAALITAAPEQQTLDWKHVSLRVTELLCHDNGAAALLEVFPFSDDTLLIPEEWLETGRIPESDKQIIALRIFTPTLRQPGQSEAYIPLSYQCKASTQDNGSLQLYYRINHGGFITSQNSPTLRLRFETIPVVKENGRYTLDRSRYAPASIAFPLIQAEQPEPTLRHATGLPLELPELGIRLDDIALSTTLLHTSFSFTYTITDRTVYDGLTGGVLFRPCNEVWNLLSNGLDNYDLCRELDEDTILRTHHSEPYTSDALYIKVYGFMSSTPLAHLTLPLE